MKKRLHFLIPIFLIGVIVASFVAIVLNLKYQHDGFGFADFSNEQVPFAELSDFAVDEDENYYIGSFLGTYTQVFDKNGKHKCTISISGRGSEFYIKNNQLCCVNSGDSDNMTEYMIDADKRKIDSKRDLSDDEYTDFLVNCSSKKPTEFSYKSSGKTYKLIKSKFQLNKVTITEGNNSTDIVVNIPWYIKGSSFYLSVIMFAFWGLVLYTFLVLGGKDKILKKLQKIKSKS